MVFVSKHQQVLVMELGNLLVNRRTGLGVGNGASTRDYLKHDYPGEFRKLSPFEFGPIVRPSFCFTRCRS
ncbi:MAG: hypothetical protein AB7G75_27690 [Candidatus Binatia bacterium]